MAQNISMMNISNASTIPFVNESQDEIINYQGASNFTKRITTIDKKVNKFHSLK